MPSKRFFTFCTVLFVLGIIIAVFSIFKETENQHNGYKRTFESSFKDSIYTINSDHSTVILKLNNKQIYIFVQATESYLKRDIMKFAQYGDKVSKAAFSDEIIIIHNDTAFKVKINKPNE